MIPASLRSAIAAEVARLEKTAGQLGASLTIDPAALLQRDLRLQTPTHWSANGHCQIVKAADGWIAVNIARQDDSDAVSAWLECPVDSAPWQAVAAHVPNRDVRALIAQATLLGLPVAALGEAEPLVPFMARAAGQTKLLADRVVVDLSALWAGPLCGGLLAQMGMDVTKIEDPLRPDPTPIATPEHDRRLNGSKQRLSLAMTDPTLLDRVAQADIVITSARPHALERLGLEPEAVFARNPDLIWVAITAHGFSGPAAMRVGFGDDCAVAGGLVEWADGQPQFLGDALADPLTGLHAARRTLDYIAAGKSGLIDAALAPTAAAFAKAAGLS